LSDEELVIFRDDSAALSSPRSVGTVWLVWLQHHGEQSAEADYEAHYEITFGRCKAFSAAPALLSTTGRARCGETVGPAGIVPVEIIPPQTNAGSIP
jgi:hypothetical protein